jgi:predicted transcriptional regulator
MSKGLRNTLAVAVIGTALSACGHDCELGNRSASVGDPDKGLFTFIFNEEVDKHWRTAKITTEVSGGKESAFEIVDDFCRGDYTPNVLQNNLGIK